MFTKIVIIIFLFISFSFANALQSISKIKTIKLYFLQTNYLPFNKNPDSVYLGVFIFKKPNKFFIKYLEDDKGNLIKDHLKSNGKYVEIYISENNETKYGYYKDLISYFPFSYIFSKDINKYFKIKQNGDYIYLFPKFQAEYNLIIIRTTSNSKFPIKYILIEYPDKRKTYFFIKKVEKINFYIPDKFFGIKISKSNLEK